MFAVNWEALCKEYAKDDDGGPSDTALLWDLLAGFVPAYFQDWLFDYVAVILYNTNRMFNSLWSESSLQASVARDYSIFFWIVAFGAYLLSVTWADISNEAWSCEGSATPQRMKTRTPTSTLRASTPASRSGSWPARCPPRVAVRRHFLMQIGDMAADALRVVPYIKYELLKRAKVASDASLAESLEPEDADLGAPAGWEAFALLVGATFACISPFTCAVCARAGDLYFVAAYEAGKHALCCLETMPFDTRGALWFDGVAQTHTALFIALVVQLVVLWFNFTNKGCGNLAQ